MTATYQGPPPEGTVRLVWESPRCGDADGKLACVAYVALDTSIAQGNAVRDALEQSGFRRCDGCGYWIAEVGAETDADRFAGLLHRLGELRLAVEHRGRGAPVTRH